MIDISDINDERIAFYRSLRYTPKLHSDNRAFIAEEEKVVLELLKSDIEVLSIFGTSEYLERYASLIEQCRVPQDQIFRADISLMKEIVGYRLHYGFLAIGRQPQDTPLLDLPRPLIVLNALANAENMGSIVRNATAFGFKSIVWDEASVSPYLRRAVRVSMGNIFQMKTYHSKSLVSTLKEVKSIDFEVVAVEITPQSKPLDSYHPKDDNFCLIFGSEGRGISDAVLEMSDRIIHIPISKKVPSLNVASSSAVVLNHFSRL